MIGERVLGAVLAGGASRRFGRDKAQAIWRGATLLEHALGSIAEQVDGLVICGREHAFLAWVPDRPAPGLGPLGGLNAALYHAVESGMDRVLTIPCDAPVLPDDLRHSLSGSDRGAYLAEMPVVGLWPAMLAPVLERHLLGDGTRSVQTWAETTGARRIPLGRAVPNVNTPGDLDVLALAG